MNHLFVPYPIALLLKEKGFDEPCFGLYSKKKKFFWADLDAIELETNSTYDGGSDIADDTITAPTYQQVVDWLREVHGIHIDIDFGLGWGYGFIPVGCEIELPKKYHEGTPQWSYYEALDAAINHAITLLS